MWNALETQPVHRRLAYVSTQVSSHSGRMADGRFVNPVFKANSEFFVLNSIPFNFTWPLKNGSSGNGDPYFFRKCERCKQARKTLSICRFGTGYQLDKFARDSRARDPDILARVDGNASIVNFPLNHSDPDTVHGRSPVSQTAVGKRSTTGRRKASAAKYEEQIDLRAKEKYPFQNCVSETSLLIAEGSVALDPTNWLDLS